MSLDTVIGCSDRDYNPFVPIDLPTSLWKLFMYQVAPAEVPLPSQKHFVFVGSTGFCLVRFIIIIIISFSLRLSPSVSLSLSLPLLSLKPFVSCLPPSLSRTHASTQTRTHACADDVIARPAGSFRWTLFAGNVSIDDTYVVNPFKDPFEATLQIPGPVLAVALKALISKKTVP